MINLKRKKKTLKDIKENIHYMEWDKNFINNLYESFSRGGFPKEKEESNGLVKL